MCTPNQRPRGPIRGRAFHPAFYHRYTAAPARKAVGDAEPEALGSFMAAWTALEQLLVSRAQMYGERVFRLGQALGTLRRH